MAEPITVFLTQFYDSPVGKIAILTMDNGQDHRKPNTLGQASMESLSSALDKVLGDPQTAGLMLTGKPYSFAAGADLSLFSLIRRAEQAYSSAKAGHSVMKRLMDLPFPSLAAINGTALGGGLEIALYCRYRTVLRSVHAIGFPECFLGLVPGWGGCTLATKLLGPEKALELIIFNALNQNRLIGGPQAFQMGLADRLFDGAEFLDESLQFLMDVIAGRVAIDRRLPAHTDPDALFSKASAFVESKVHGASPAPYRAIQLIEGACGWDLEKGFEEENKAIGDLIPSRQCKAAIYSFDLVNRYGKHPQGLPEAKPLTVNKAGIIGAGLMASQLANLFVQRLEVPVVMKDVAQDAVDKGRGYVLEEIDKSVLKGRLSEGKAKYLKELIKGTLGYEDFRGCDLVIEAVFEDMGAKKQVLGEVETVIGPDAVLATNTSSLSVTKMAEDLWHPERVLGLHFFNPVSVMPLVEVIKGKKTDDVTVSTAFEFVRKLRKTGILVKDSPAFLVNRILIRMLTDCMTLVDKGAGFRQVDDAIRAIGIPMGPFELLGLVGPAVAFHAAETLNHAFGSERFPVHDNFRRMVEKRIGTFYDPAGESGRILPRVEELWVRSWEGEFSADQISRGFWRTWLSRLTISWRKKWWEVQRMWTSP